MVQVVDRDVSVGCMMAWGLWVAGVLAMLTGTLLDSVVWQNWALLLALAGGTATIRSYFVRQNRLVREALDEREEEVRVRRVR